MKRFKNWLITNFLPMWAKETVLYDNKRLKERNRKLEQQNRELKIYIQSVHDVLGSFGCNKEEVEEKTDE